MQGCCCGILLEMDSYLLKQVFWILAALPVFVLGVFLFVSLTKTVYTRYTEEQKKKEESAVEEKKRQTFEESYSRRRSGGI